MTYRMTLGLAAIASLVVLAGCDSRDPFRRTGVWQPSGANAGNIAAMVANPHDLISGRSAAVQNANESALSVNHVWADQPKSLSTGGGGGGGGGASGASGGGSGGASGASGS